VEAEGPPVRRLLLVLALAGCGEVTLEPPGVDGGADVLEHGNTGLEAAAADVLETASSPCNGVAPWARGDVYAVGDHAESAGSLYVCRSSGWCGFDADYAPGIGSRWQDAWMLVGACQ
jgi:hypothetical protein